MLTIPAIPLAIVLLATLVAAVTDVWKYKISNQLTCPLLVSGLIYHGIAMEGMGLVPGMLGAGLGCAPMALVYLSGGMGAGDVKLMTGLGAWLGPHATIQVLYVSWLAAGLYAVGVLLVNALSAPSDRVRYRLPVRTPPGSDPHLSQLTALPNRRRRLIPFGVMILAGIVATMI